jgi:hypothetical protein
VTLTLAELAHHLEAVAESVKPSLEVALGAIGAHTVEVARAMIGHPHPEWPPLAESTLARKHGNTPLLETGEMRDSIKAAVIAPELELVVGSTDPKSKFHELGTHKIPPRPFIGPSAIASIPFAEKTLGETAVKLLTPGGKP